MFSSFIQTMRQQYTLSRVVAIALAVRHMAGSSYSDTILEACSKSTSTTQFSTLPGTMAKRMAYSSTKITSFTHRSLSLIRSAMRLMRTTRQGRHLWSRPCQYIAPELKSGSVSASVSGSLCTRSCKQSSIRSTDFAASNRLYCRIRRALRRMNSGSSSFSSALPPVLCWRLHSCRSLARASTSSCVKCVFRKMKRTCLEEHVGDMAPSANMSSADGSNKTTSAGSRCSLCGAWSLTQPPMPGKSISPCEGPLVKRSTEVSL
mmetsp:Transcript_72969/g.117654  ORF Transcript_72969/g.117654 Transcript_72969/m.117654 type:complete len:262 (+) Transcript_72969:995-1780(+)